ncbi:MAG: NlpC/P60 family [Porphyrobacter sp. HL-46]|nr:MAG: NlpC/P60 family [Porphyrobacter sp. HL-46]
MPMPACDAWFSSRGTGTPGSAPNGAYPQAWKARTMATLLLTALGTAIGGPIGGTIGALIGQQADAMVFGGGTRQGPRLRELAITTSSYGQPIPRNFGRMRAAGTIIWSTDLIESKRKEKGRKGQPSTVSYSYSASFAVALSSTPITRLGRIWADGSLLRGALGDLKVAGQLRFYSGFGDDPVDPLIAADKGSNAPAFRDCAYVVFEELELGDFGNRIPALSFELFGDGGDEAVSLNRLVPDAQSEPASAILSHARGFADEGGPLGSTLSAIDQVIPLVCTSGRGGLRIMPRAAASGPIAILPQRIIVAGSSPEEARHKQRGERPVGEPAAIRYYDESRDYQPGVQRALGSRRMGREVMIDLPATMTAPGAKKLANESANRARWRHETMLWRIGDLDPRLEPGSVVRLPDEPGFWLIRSWEWLDRGIELLLERLAPELASDLPSDAGQASPPADQVLPLTRLAAFEIPGDGDSNPATRTLFAAASAENSAWRGAALYVVQGSSLVPLGNSGTRRAIMGVLIEGLDTSPTLLFEPEASLEVALVASDLELEDADVAGLAAGANRMIVGGEVLQFAQAAR